MCRRPGCLSTCVSRFTARLLLDNRGMDIAFLKEKLKIQFAYGGVREYKLGA